MTVTGLVVVGGFLAVLALWVLSLVRRGRLYIGYGVIWLLLIGAGGLSLFLRGGVSAAESYLGPSGLHGLGFVGIAFMLVYVLSQLSILSNRVATVVRELAIERARDSVAGGHES